MLGEQNGEKVFHLSKFHANFDCVRVSLSEDSNVEMQITAFICQKMFCISDV